MILRVVADTNVYISALMYGGAPGLLLDYALSRLFELMVSTVLLDELDEKLQIKFGVSPEDASAIRSKLETVGCLAKPEMTLNVITDDPDDDRVLECAAEGKAHYIVSGDRHLLKLKQYEGISILTVRQFLTTIEQQGLYKN